MRLSSDVLLPALSQLQQATSPRAQRRAGGVFYAVAHPLLTARCADLLHRYAPMQWRAAEDLASDVLVKLVIAPESVRACTECTGPGILRWLRSIAYHDLLNHREERARRAGRAAPVALTDRLAAQLCVTVPARATRATRAFWQTYTHAVRRLPALTQRIWIDVVEHESSVAEVAAALGRSPSTVRRRVRQGTAVLQRELARFAPTHAHHLAPAAPRPRRRR